VRDGTGCFVDDNVQVYWRIHVRGPEVAATYERPLTRSACGEPAERVRSHVSPCPIKTVKGMRHRTTEGRKKRFGETAGSHMAYEKTYAVLSAAAMRHDP
jgi:hypothetical protein